MRTLVTGRYRMTFWEDDPLGELFDREADPLELRNLWNDPGSQDLKRELLEMMTRELPTSERDLVEGYGGSDREDGPGELVAVNAALDAASSEATSRSIDPTGRREALGDLIDNQPDEVADLLRSWLGDRRETPR